VTGLPRVGDNATMAMPGHKRIGAPRVLRGGAFNNRAENLRASNRNRNDPRNRNRNIGFRCVLALPRQHAAQPATALLTGGRHAGPGRGLASGIHCRPVPVAHRASGGATVRAGPSSSLSRSHALRPLP
jgi:hypothetical protein